MEVIMGPLLINQWHKLYEDPLSKIKLHAAILNRHYQLATKMIVSDDCNTVNYGEPV